MTANELKISIDSNQLKEGSKSEWLEIKLVSWTNYLNTIFYLIFTKYHSQLYTHNNLKLRIL